MPHGAITKPVVVSTVLTDGYAGNLAKGQLAFVKNKARKGYGAEVVSDFAGMTEKDLISIRVGEVTTPENLRTKEVASKSTGFFPIGSIVDIKAYAPTNVTLKVDHLEVGYDGINDETALYVPEGKSAAMDIKVHGDVASMFFGREEYLIQKRVYRDIDEPMQSVVRRLVKELNEEAIPTATGYASVTDKLSKFLEIGIIDSEATPVTGVDSVFSTIEVQDKGDSNDLADIQAQYPDYKVVRTARLGDFSTYTILHPVSVTLADYDKETVNVVTKGCDTCAAGYTLAEGGFVYHVSLEDDGDDDTATVQAIPGALLGSAVKFGNKDGKGTYSVITDNPLTQAEYDTFITANPTAELTLKGEIKDVCEFSDTESFTWVDGETCTASTVDYKITLKDNKCGQSRLAELQAAYPDLVIQEGVYTGTTSTPIVITGGSGDISLVIGGNTYATTFTTDIATTIAAFITAHAADILTDTGATATGNATTITITAPSDAYPTITATAGGMTETIGAAVNNVTAAAGGCKRTYSTKVPTNIVCDECSDIFLQPFYGQAPEAFENVGWVEVVDAPSETAKMGFFIKGKPFFLYPEAIEEDFIPFMETSLKVKSASFGWREDDILNYTGSNYDVDLEFARVEKLQYAQDVHNLSQDFFGAESMGNKHFTNKKYYERNLFSRANLSAERILDYHKKMIQFHVIYRDQLLSQGGGHRSDISHDFMIVVEYGKHEDLQNILGALAAKVGLSAPQITL